MKHCYIHIPFCQNICSYCDFCKVLYNEELVNKYLLYLEREINSIYKNDILDTIYIGGGTPSSLNVKQLDKLLKILTKLKQSKTIEYSIECNFSSITLEKLNLFKKYGINRLSFGLESINSKNLKILERTESKRQIIKIIELCKKLGFTNINIDLMYAIPKESIKDLQADLDFILALDVSHISTYSLIIEPHTKLAINRVNYIDEDLDYKMYQLICKNLADNYDHYEISNFAKKGFQSKHNLCYWQNKNYYGFGLGASSYIGTTRINNTKSLTKYLQDKYILNYENLTKNDIMSYEMILGLRLLQGINKDQFKEKYAKDIYDAFPIINNLLNKNLLVDDGNSIYIKEDKVYVSNEILINFIKE